MRTLNTGFNTGSNQNVQPRGFALISVLLLLLIVSALAVSVSYLTIREKKVSGSDRDNNVAYYGAEGGLEKISSDLTYLYQKKMSPTQADLSALSGTMPTLPGITFSEYKVMPTNGTLTPVSATITAGPNAGLNALLVRLTSSVIAQAPGASQVRMVRNLEVALIPVFQFGMFSNTDLTFHNGKAMDFYGRVHTNGSLYLVPQATATFHDRLSAFGEIIRQSMPTGGSSAGYQGNVAIPTQANGCPSLQATAVSTTFCRFLAITEGSLPYSGSAPLTWSLLSSTTYNSMVINHAKQLTLPFVSGNAQPVEIIRLPPVGESATEGVGLSRYFNEAQIRVLLDDDYLALGTVAPECKNLEDGVHYGTVELDTTAQAVAHPKVTVYPTTGSPFTGYKFAQGKTGKYANWKLSGAPDVSLLNTQTTAGYVHTYLCVLGKNTAGVFVPITNEWLTRGFESGTHPLAILHLQKPATVVNVDPNYNSWPINIYDAREGEYRDTTTGKAASTCAINGIMNLVELDVGMLNNWLVNSTTGKSIDKVTQSGYILYFSDRRGMLVNQNLAVIPKVKNGVSGLEDLINLPVGGPGAFNHTPDGTTSNGFFAEDVDHNGQIDRWGEQYLGVGFGLGAWKDPGQTRVSAAIAEANIVAGPRHALRLVNGASGNLPSNNGAGGFSVASEQPVYIWKNYNATNGDDTVPDVDGNFTWPSSHRASSVVADAVTLLSNNWDDTKSFTSPFTSGNRNATETWYRTAIAAGKNQTFSDAGATVNYGGDGGVHNFLRYLEDWSNVTSHYRGSMVSFYYSQYATGIYKAVASTVYSPPVRSYEFDTDFLNNSNLPPGTPMFRDVENVGGHQDFSVQ